MKARSVEAILSAVREIPPGFVRTYGDVCPGAPRFTGTALRGVGDRVPWWRVVRADGTLAAGDEQRRRLEAEGVPFLSADPPRLDMRTARLPDGLV
ncbi:MAG TPA: MGMT family protein [Solirubrobacteraceae bacterium]|jgi:alkylated DNA nucleotide flippase Atl1|nr:MGMT family protein [Solirubrobacteraceae bacterium]